MEREKEIIDKNNHSYFSSLQLGGIKCFKDIQTLDLSDGTGNYAPWTIILGDNGTGKTTLLKALDRMQPKVETDAKYSNILPLYSQNSKLTNNRHYIKLEFWTNGIPESYHVSYFPDQWGSDGGSTGNNYAFLISYGASRRMSREPRLSNNNFNIDRITSLFDESIDLINAEEWYLQKFLKFKTSENGIKIKLEQQLSLIKKVLIDFLPDVLDLRIKEIKTVNDKSALEVKINENEWINLRELSFGYQTLTALIVDIASKMMEQYPNSDNPLEEPVVILIDEIDLHLHPKWQRTVIDKLSNHFPKAQFIATAHSPLIVQVAQDRNANIVVCRKEGDKTIIDNNPAIVKGWRVDQILTSDLFEVESPRSPTTQESFDRYVELKGKKQLSDSDTSEMEKLIPVVKQAYNNNKEIDLDNKLKQFADKYLK